jgi:hypothetical protein
LAEKILGQAKNGGAEKRQDKKARLHKIDLQEQKHVFLARKESFRGIGFNFLPFGLPSRPIYTFRPRRYTH